MDDEQINKQLALEKAYDEARDKASELAFDKTVWYNTSKLTLEELRAVVAYELWRSGMEWKGNDDRDSIIQTLTDVFGY